VYRSFLLSKHIVAFDIPRIVCMFSVEVCCFVTSCVSKFSFLSVLLSVLCLLYHDLFYIPMTQVHGIPVICLSVCLSVWCGLSYCIDLSLLVAVHLPEYPV